jgi:hypothetical protein
VAIKRRRRQAANREEEDMKTATNIEETAAESNVNMTIYPMTSQLLYSVNILELGETRLISIFIVDH